MFQTNLEEKIKRHFVFSDVFDNCVVYKIMWKNAVEPDRPQMKICRMGIPHGIPKAANTH